MTNSATADYRSFFLILIFGHIFISTHLGITVLFIHLLTTSPSLLLFFPFLPEFCELRPGLIGWLIINLGMAYKQFTLRKSRSLSGRGSISMSMLLVTLFQGFYVWDALYMEKVMSLSFLFLSTLSSFLLLLLLSVFFLFLFFQP